METLVEIAKRLKIKPNPNMTEADYLAIKDRIHKELEKMAGKVHPIGSDLDSAVYDIRKGSGVADQYDLNGQAATKSFFTEEKNCSSGTHPYFGEGFWYHAGPKDEKTPERFVANLKLDSPDLPDVFKKLDDFILRHGGKYKIAFYDPGWKSKLLSNDTNRTDNLNLYMAEPITPELAQEFYEIVKPVLEEKVHEFLDGFPMFRNGKEIKGIKFGPEPENLEIKKRHEHSERIRNLVRREFPSFLADVILQKRLTQYHSLGKLSSKIQDIDLVYYLMGREGENPFQLGNQFGEPNKKAYNKTINFSDQKKTLDRTVETNIQSKESTTKEEKMADKKTKMDHTLTEGPDGMWVFEQQEDDTHRYYLYFDPQTETVSIQRQIISDGKIVKLTNDTYELRSGLHTFVNLGLDEKEEFERILSTDADVISDEERKGWEKSLKDAGLGRFINSADWKELGARRVLTGDAKKRHIAEFLKLSGLDKLPQEEESKAPAKKEENKTPAKKEEKVETKVKSTRSVNWDGSWIYNQEESADHKLIWTFDPNTQTVATERLQIKDGKVIARHRQTIDLVTGRSAWVGVSIDEDGKRGRTLNSEARIISEKLRSDYVTALKKAGFADSIQQDRWAKIKPGKGLSEKEQKALIDQALQQIDDAIKADKQAAKHEAEEKAEKKVETKVTKKEEKTNVPNKSAAEEHPYHKAPNGVIYHTIDDNGVTKTESFDPKRPSIITRTWTEKVKDPKTGKEKEVSRFEEIQAAPKGKWTLYAVSKTGQKRVMKKENTPNPEKWAAYRQATLKKAQAYFDRQKESKVEDKVATPENRASVRPDGVKFNRYGEIENPDYKPDTESKVEGKEPEEDTPDYQIGSDGRISHEITDKDGKKITEYFDLEKQTVIHVWKNAKGEEIRQTFDLIKKHQHATIAKKVGSKVRKLDYGHRGPIKEDQYKELMDRFNIAKEVVEATKIAGLAIKHDDTNTNDNTVQDTLRGLGVSVPTYTLDGKILTETTLSPDGKERTVAEIWLDLPTPQKYTHTERLTPKGKWEVVVPPREELKAIGAPYRPDSRDIIAKVQILSKAEKAHYQEIRDRFSRTKTDYTYDENYKIVTRREETPTKDGFEVLVTEFHADENEDWNPDGSPKDGPARFMKAYTHIEILDKNRKLVEKKLPLPKGFEGKLAELAQQGRTLEDLGLQTVRGNIDLDPQDNKSFVRVRYMTLGEQKHYERLYDLHKEKENGGHGDHGGHGGRGNGGTGGAGITDDDRGNGGHGNGGGAGGVGITDDDRGNGGHGNGGGAGGVGITGGDKGDDGETEKTKKKEEKGKKPSFWKRAKKWLLIAGAVGILAWAHDKLSKRTHVEKPEGPKVTHVEKGGKSVDVAPLPPAATNETAQVTAPTPPKAAPTAQKPAVTPPTVTPTAQKPTVTPPTMTPTGSNTQHAPTPHMSSTTTVVVGVNVSAPKAKTPSPEITKDTGAGKTAPTPSAVRGTTSSGLSVTIDGGTYQIEKDSVVALRAMERERDGAPGGGRGVSFSTHPVTRYVNVTELGRTPAEVAAALQQIQKGLADRSVELKVKNNQLVMYTGGVVRGKKVSVAVNLPSTRGNHSKKPAIPFLKGMNKDGKPVEINAENASNLSWDQLGKAQAPKTPTATFIQVKTTTR